eukprot:NODE_5015_length_710_cov_8.768439_g4852_i0.p1 GENE.NODE_5015_length_710_cov_8.768439_g4852_i0~~NODE_5015_length_710_cov_8.768439_g4852_i0.p1  ORF type:complete len:208 (-),score=61.73 NODE_5015_length_710_cov_8.768439_g4852_i0:86-646(-)
MEARLSKALALSNRRPQLHLNTQCAHRIHQRFHSEDEFASEIFPWLYLGNARDAVNYDTLKSKNIKWILNISKEVDCPEAERLGYTYMQIDVEDNSDVPIGDHFHSATEFIENARKHQERILVHCRRGISRSATIVIAYVMQYTNMSFDEAFDYVKAKRHIINPNLGFVLALESMTTPQRLELLAH